MYQSFQLPSIHHRLPRRRAATAARTLTPADQLWVWRGAFLLGAVAWIALGCAIKAIV
jgi:hypothetical protein